MRKVGRMGGDGTGTSTRPNGPDLAGTPMHTVCENVMEKLSGDRSCCSCMGDDQCAKAGPVDELTPSVDNNPTKIADRMMENASVTERGSRRRDDGKCPCAIALIGMKVQENLRFPVAAQEKSQEEVGGWGIKG